MTNAQLSTDELPTLRLRTLRRLLGGRPILVLHHAMPIAVARALFLETRVPIAAIVTEGDDTLVGTIAWRELRRIDSEILVGDVMDPEIVTAPAEGDLESATALMAEHGVDRIVVVGGNGELVGILDAQDLAR